MARHRLDLREVVLFLATGAYCGRSPVAPASLASLATLLGVVLLRESWFLGTGFPLTVAAALALGFAVAGRAEAMLGEKDAKSIVIDDVAGLLIAVWGFQHSGVDVLLGLWLLFRAIDNVKVFPLGLIEARLKGGLAIMLDDVVAGLYANLLFRLGAAGLHSLGAL